MQSRSGATEFARRDIVDLGRRNATSTPKLVSTPAGDVEVGIPKLQQGSFYPEPLVPRRRTDKALWAVTMHAYITGTSTRTVDDLVP